MISNVSTSPSATSPGRLDPDFLPSIALVLGFFSPLGDVCGWTGSFGEAHLINVSIRLLATSAVRPWTSARTSIATKFLFASWRRLRLDTDSRGTPPRDGVIVSIRLLATSAVGHW